MALNTWSGVSLTMSSDLGAEVAITGISQANPAVVTHAGADPANGSFIFVKAQGMTQASGQHRVINSAAGSYELEGLDSTGFDAFTSGTMQAAPNDVSFATITDLSASGGDTNTADATTIHQLFEVSIPTTTTAVEYDLTSHWDITDTGLIAAKRLSSLRKETSFLLTWPNLNKAAFAGFISAALIPTGSAQEIVTTPLKITVTGEFSFYAS